MGLAFDAPRSAGLTSIASIGVRPSMNGAQSLVKSLVASGIDTCFANPGTSEMHFVGALDSAPELRAVLCLFEGVATGAADGFARMTGRPAATLLHLGAGLANGASNLHNSRRAGSPRISPASSFRFRRARSSIIRRCAGRPRSAAWR